MSDYTLPDPKMIAPVKAAPESELFEDWPLLFRAGSDDSGENWGLCTHNVRASELLDGEFPSDAKSDSLFIATLINAYRTGELVYKDGGLARKEEA